MEASDEGAEGFEVGPAAAAGGVTAVELVPLVVGADGLGGERLALLEFCEVMDWLLDLRVEPTNLRKRWFMDDMWDS